MNFAAFDLLVGTNTNVQRQFTKYLLHHTRKQKKLYVKHQCGKKYLIFIFRAMDFSDIMAEAVLSIEKSCLVVHAFKRSFEKVKGEIIRCSVRWFMRSISINSRLQNTIKAY